MLRSVAAGAYAVLFAALFVGALVAAYRGRPLPAGAVRVGVGYSLLIVLLQLPMLAANMWYLDPRPLLDELPEPLVDRLADRLAMVVGVSAMVSAAAGAAWRAWLPAVGARHGARWALIDGGRPWATVAAATAVGALLGLGAAAVGAEPGLTGVDAAWPLYPALPDRWRLPLTLSAAAAAALTEEVALRGWLLPALATRLGGPAAVVVAAAASAAAHALTASPLALGAAFVVGLGAGALARGRSVEHAAAAHVGFALARAAAG